MLISNIYDFIKNKKKSLSFIYEVEQPDEEQPEENIDNQSEDSNVNNIDNQDIQDNDNSDMQDDGMGGDDMQDDGMGGDGMGADGMGDMGQAQEPTFNNMKKSDIYQSYDELVKKICRNLGYRLEGPFDKEMGITFNSKVHNDVYWNAINKKDQTIRFTVSVNIDPEYLFNKYGDKPKEEDLQDGGSDEPNKQDITSLTNQESPKGKFKLDLYFPEEDIRKRNFIANVDKLIQFIKKLDTKKIDRDFKKIDKDKLKNKQKMKNKYISNNNLE